MPSGRQPFGNGMLAGSGPPAVAGAASTTTPVRPAATAASASGTTSLRIAAPSGRNSSVPDTYVLFVGTVQYRMAYSTLTGRSRSAAVKPDSVAAMMSIQRSALWRTPRRRVGSLAAAATGAALLASVAVPASGTTAAPAPARPNVVFV